MKKLLLLALTIGWTWRVQADLSATVYPGYTFGASERPTTSKLNALGTPTIIISGTIGGTNSGLAADSITGAMLDSTTYDNVTIDKTNGALRVKQAGITTYQLYTNMFSTTSALNPSTGAVVWNPDWNFLAISNNMATMRTSTVAAAVIALLNSSTYTYSNQVAVPAAANATSMSHGMGATPSWWRVTLVCTNADLNYAAGDEVDLSCASVSNDERAFSAYIDPAATPSIVVRRSDNLLALNLLNKTTGVWENMTMSRWNLRFRVRQ